MLRAVTAVRHWYEIPPFSWLYIRILVVEIGLADFLAVFLIILKLAAFGVMSLLYNNEFLVLYIAQ